MGRNGLDENRVPQQQETVPMLTRRRQPVLCCLPAPGDQRTHTAAMRTHDDDDVVASGVILPPSQETISASENDTSDLNMGVTENGKEDGDAVERGDHEKDDRITESETSDPYRYLVRDGGTSCELFKIEIHNLPRYTSYTTLKKLFVNKFNLKPHKIKLIGNPVKFAFIAFSNEQDRQTALQSLSGFAWKGCTLTAAVAAPKADPLAAKRIVTDEHDGVVKKKIRENADGPDSGDADGAEMDVSVRLNDQVASLWRLPYAAQLEEKTKIVNEFLIDLHKDIGRMIDHSKTEQSVARGQVSKDQLFKWYMTSKKNFDRKPCPVEPVRPSPVIDGYRNKCEFSFGTDKTVGFRMGCYKKGSLQVAPVAECPIVSPAMKKIVSLVERYMRESSKLLPFDAVTHAGNWKQLMVRTNAGNDSALVVLSLEAKALSDDHISTEKRLLSESFSTEPCVTSLFLELIGKKNKDQRLQLIFGKPSLSEKMTVNGKDLTFEVSPDAFFQINTPAAHVCYETIAELLHLNKETLLLDVCCGTGTIGISLADRVSKVIGIELNEEAVKDAERNAATNNVSNIQFMSGKAEDLVVKAISLASNHRDAKEIVAVIDPPRAGLSECLHLRQLFTSDFTFFRRSKCNEDFAVS